MRFAVLNLASGAEDVSWKRGFQEALEDLQSAVKGVHLQRGHKSLMQPCV